jgi:hypothetical protein
MTFQSEYGSIANYSAMSPADRIFLDKKEITDTEIKKDGSMIDHYKFTFIIPEIGNKRPYFTISFNVDENKWLTDTAVASGDLPKEFHTKSFEMIVDIAM